MSFFSKKTLLALIAAFTLASCDRNGDENINEDNGKEFQLAFSSGSGSITGVYMRGMDDLSQGTVSFDGKGYLLSEARTSRIFHSDDKKYVYSLAYQVGTIGKWEFLGGSNYKKVGEIDAGIPLGNKGIRFYKLNNNEGSVHYIKSEPEYEPDGTTYKHHKMSLSLGILDFNTMTVKPSVKKNIPFTLPGNLPSQGYHITRIDAPVLSNGKLYYGAAVSKFDPTTGKNSEADKAMTLVVDYPSLENPTVVETALVKGSTNGYRTPTQYVTENGEIIQLVNSRSGKTHIVKLVNGQYDATYKFSLDEALGRPGKTSSNGFFYAGNGIVFMPYEKKHIPAKQIGVDPQGNPTQSSPWGLARIDLNSKTVVDLEVPDNLWLTQWQTSVIKNGKFYIALAPVGQQGHIYTYDVHSTSAVGTKGAATVSGADQYFIGLY